jgi:ATP-dependent Clp protease ATP-binding subunit ClpA
MFERFTDSARQAVVLAQEEARALGHDHVGAEHLLLGLARESQGGASRALAASRATLPALRRAVAQTGGGGQGSRSGQLSFDSAARLALEQALAQSGELGYSYVATEHLLLGVLASEDAVVSAVLMAVPTSAERIREETLRILEDTKPLRPESTVGRPAGEHDVALSWSARELLLAAAARAHAGERAEVLPADLLAALLADADVATRLSGVGVDAGAALAALEQAPPAD